MHTVSIFEAKTHLSRIVESIISSKEDQIIISRHGKPVAMLTSLPDTDISKRIGIARDCFVVPDDIDSMNDEIALMFATSTENQ